MKKPFSIFIDFVSNQFARNAFCFRRPLSVMLLALAAPMLMSVPAYAEPDKAAFVKQEKVNINMADAAELSERLVGIGESKAQAIVEFRQKYGNFRSADELSEVKGIGEAILEKNKSRITL